MADDSQEVADIIDGLGDSPAPLEVYNATRDYDTRYLASAGAAAAAGGGGGGSQPLTVVRTSFAWDSPNIGTTGFVIYTPAAGDINRLTESQISVPTAFNANAILGFGTPVGRATASFLFSLSAHSENNPDYNGDGEVTQFALAPVGNQNFEFNNTDPLMVFTDDGDGGDPGSTAGEGEAILVILKASA